MTFDPREDGANCDECPLKDKRPVRPELRPGAPIIVGMEPGAQEVKLGRPFVGQSGKLLDAILKENGLRRDYFQITNARLCSAPPTWSDNDARHRLAFQACRPRLERELATAPSVLMFGKHALTQVFGSKAGTGEDGIMSVRGYPLEITNGEGETKPGLATFHPAFVLRQRRWRETVSRDIAKFWRLTTGTLNWVEPRIIFDPTYEELCAALSAFEKAGTPVAIDTETDGLDPEKANLRCVGLANADLAIIIGFRSVENPLRTFRCPPEKARIAIANFLKRFRPLGGHNVNVYDRPVLARHGMPLPAYDEVIDTLALHHLTDSEAPHKLGFIGSYEFDIPKWKADDHEAWESDEELHVYCGLDCVVTARLIPILLEQLIASDQERVYWSDIRLQEFAVNAHRIGIFIDEAERKRHGDRFDAAVLRAQAVSDDIIGRRINLSSPKQVAAYLYDECGIAPPSDWEPGIGDPSTGIDALYEILTRAVPPHIEKFVDNLILYRRARMWRVRYVDACAPAADGRVHPIWNPTTVKTGRLSCSDPAMQQIPDRKHDIDTLRSMFRAAPGNCYVYADMAQIQLRQVALASGDVPWLEAFVAGKDVHRVNGQTFFGIPYDKIGKNSFQRDFAKTLTYMYLFGGQAETAMRNMQKVRNPKTGERPYAKFSLTESETMRERLLRDHPALPRWWRSLIEEWRANRFLASRILGRRRYFKDSEIDDEDLNEMAAHEIQSWEGDIMGGAGATGRTMDRIPHGLFGPGLIFHGHDALLLEVRKAEKERAEKALVEAMTTECDGLPFPAEAKTGEVWSQLE